MNELIAKIEQWGRDRNLHEGATLYGQYCKLYEEAGELLGAILSEDESDMKDAIGDITVVLIRICLKQGWSFQDCVQLAYDEIKDRKGRMVDGVFVKEDQP